MDVKESLKTVIEERDRLRIFEELVKASKYKEQHELEQKKHTSRQIWEHLQADSANLREELQSVRMQAYLADKHTTTQIERDEALLEETIQAALVMEVLFCFRGC
jgi:hypothetical protein